MALEYIAKGATLSPDGRYRYSLWREWRGTHDPNNWEWMYADQGVPKPCVFIMLNPSTADSQIDDPTIRKCVGFAWRWRYEKLVVINLFAYRTANPKELRGLSDPVGPHNSHHIREILQQAGRVICAWGADESVSQQDQTMMGWLDAESIQPFCLGTTKLGAPRHPLYIPYGNPISRFNPL